MTLVGLLGSAIFELSQNNNNRGLERNMWPFSRGKNVEKKEEEISRRDFLKVAGTTAAGIVLAPLTAFAGGMKSWPEAIVKSDYEVIRFFYEQYLIDGFKGSTNLLQKSLSCRTSWSQQEGVEEAFANDPAMAYVAELFNSKYFNGELSFGHDGEKRFGASNQDNTTYKNNPTLNSAIWTIHNYFKKFKRGEGKYLFNNAYRTFAYAFTGDKNNWEGFKHKIENGLPISLKFVQPQNNSHKLATLWAAGILTRTYEKLEENQKANFVRDLLEKPIEKEVGYSLGKLDF